MHTGPVPGTFTSDWKPVGSRCRHCDGAVMMRVWESDCGGYEDHQYRCEACGVRWWVEGPDA
jgi:DNA-directed RNA polymerase subunit RPC12/RpoP